MSNAKTVTRNIAWNWAGMGFGIVSGILVTPLLVHRLGESGYGLWILIASLTSYFSLLDLGVRGSVGRHIALHRATSDQNGVNFSLSTAVAILCGGAAVALLVTFLAEFVFFDLFEVPAARLVDVRWALLIVGLNLAISLPLSVFDGTLWAFQRFDILNAIDIPAILLRITLTVLLVDGPEDLVLLSLITLITALLPAVAKAIISFRIDRNLQLGLTKVSRETARLLLGYGSWLFLLSIGRIFTTQIGPVIIGARLGVSMVTPYSIAMRLIGVTSSCVIAATGVFTPIATAIHAEKKYAQQQKLFLEGGKYCMALALFFLFIFVLLGGPLISVWMGGEMKTAARLLIIFAVGEVIPMSQQMSNSVILGMGRHRPLAYLCVAESLFVVTLSLAVAAPFGLTGICIVYAIAGAVFRGLAQLVYSCRLLEVTVFTFVRQALLPAVVASLLPVVFLGVLVALNGPSNWLLLLAYGTIYLALWALSLVYLSGRIPPIFRRLTCQLANVSPATQNTLIDGQLAEKL
jgi:O-antigen/teichoic acid export membrane protein